MCNILVYVNSSLCRSLPGFLMCVCVCAVCCVPCCQCWDIEVNQILMEGERELNYTTCLQSEEGGRKMLKPNQIFSNMVALLFVYVLFIIPCSSSNSNFVRHLGFSAQLVQRLLVRLASSGWRVSRSVKKFMSLRTFR